MLQIDDAMRAALGAELVPMGTLWARLGGIHTLSGAPFGTRMIVDITDVRVEGPRLDAHMKGQATADWGSLGSEGTFQLDVRVTLETHDGALIFVDGSLRPFSKDPAEGEKFISAFQEDTFKETATKFVDAQLPRDTPAALRERILPWRVGLASTITRSDFSASSSSLMCLRITLLSMMPNSVLAKM